MSFSDTGLDPRLLRALAKRGLTKPTPVQLAAIPKTLEGKDVVARARTGSGKTLAYLLPALHRLLSNLTTADGSAAGSGASIQLAGAHSFQAVVLVPTRELCEQVKTEAHEVVQHCGVDVLVTSLTASGGASLKRAVASSGHLVVATPGKLAAAIREGALQGSVLESRLQTLVLDEADLLLSYGYEADLQMLAPLVPRSCQVLLMSATTSQDVEALQRLVLHNPITLNLLAEGAQGGQDAAGLAEGSGASSTITHWSYECDKDDRLLVVMALLKLGLVRRKVLLFVNSVDTAYRVKLFLETFGIRAALLNAEMPLNSRSHCLASFNKGMFDYLIATDDVHAAAAGPSQPPSKKRRRNDSAKKGSKTSQGAAKDEEFGVTRGIDFKGVHTIINYDLPPTTQGYVHRVGRTGRGGAEGAAVTLFTPEDELFRAEVAGMLRERAGGAAQAQAARGEQDGIVSGSDDEEEPAAGAEGGAAAGLRPFTRLSKAQIEALRYRGEDVARSITKSTIKEARAKELRAELLNSDKLKDYFETHAAERQLLRHDKSLHKAPQAPSLRHLPAYIKDPALIQEATATGNRAPPMLSAHKRRKLPKTAEAKVTGVTGANMSEVAAGQSLSRGREDPLKKVTGFVRAPKGGGHHDEQLTDMEKRAMAAGRKEAKKRAKAEGLPVQAKRNVRKFKRHR